MVKKLMGTSQAARALELSEERVRQLVRDGKLKVEQRTFDGRQFYDPVEVERLRVEREDRSNHGHETRR
jgi:hypothetical protein